MDLDSRAYSKLIHEHNTHGGSEEYIRIVEALRPLHERYDHESPEMWCSRIRDPFRKILEDNPRFLSKNGYIIMHGKLYENDRVHRRPTNYIYCSVCDSSVFIPSDYYSDRLYHDSHLKRCISGNTISDEHVRRKEVLQSIDRTEYAIWQYKQYILQEEAEIKRLQLELTSQPLSHLEKDSLASISYDRDTRTYNYESYAQSKATVAKNTMPSAPNFEPACISVTSDNQEMVSPTSYQSSNCRSDTDKLFISFQYVKQPKGTVLRLGDGTEITVV
ncbi:hypothetical protein RhiirC2_827575 [Rhizophagus irregularis]|uniref:Uncharacterized protein n=1 Tax=Rhizophagus irregularis TaxID=588596 RepID=A0A2N1M5G3_9GLOM|nr:hypothetical protein RhiirC2_827575 [Rhizophagus irregularis]